MSHFCHAHKCKTKIAPKYAMCPPHWMALTRGMRASIIANYRKGQERDKSPTVAYMSAMYDAKIFLATQEHPQDVAELEKYRDGTLAWMKKREKEPGGPVKIC